MFATPLALLRAETGVWPTLPVLMMASPNCGPACA